MSYIGNQPINAAFLTDTFSGNGSTVAFTMQVAPANTSSILVVVTGVTQDPSTYSVVGTTLTFSAAPPTGTNNISVRYLGIPASGVTTAAYRTVAEFTATAGQTTFSVPSYTVGYIDVYRSGSQLGSADYTASNGTTVVLANAATAGELIRTISFSVSSVLNAVPQSGGTVSGNLIVTGTETVPTITSPSATALTLQTNNGTTAVTIDTSQNVGIGTGTPATPLDVNGRIRTRGSANFLDAYHNGTIGVLETTGGASTPLVFATAGAERMRIDSSGNVGIGVTPDTWTITQALQIGATYGGAWFGSSTSSGGAYVGANNYYNGAFKYKTANPATYYTQNANVSGSHEFYVSTNSPSAGGNVTFSRALLVANGYAVALQGATPATGTGITFPAAQSASTDPNTLDDYEEGTWTPTFSYASGVTAPTYGTSNFTYTKIGRLVHITGYVNFYTVGSGSGLRVTGLPFVGNANYTLAPLWTGGGSIAYTCYMVGGQAQLNFGVAPGSSGGASSSNIPTELSVQMSYITNA